jgi:hypothetical protein
MSTRTLALVLRVFLLVVPLLSWVGLPSVAEALPMYAQRSGRTCANCHVSPTLEDEKGWENPELMDRKCTMQCVSCHVNPTGGGLRNASGRYYGQSTLSIFHRQERSYSDLQRELAPNDLRWKIRQFLDEDPAKGAVEGRTVPSDWGEVLEGVGEGQTGDWTSFGNPDGQPHEMGFWDGRYDDLNADPVFQVGGDIRAAWWSGTGAAFPMQVDLHAAVHPIEHLTAMTTVAARARSTGPIDGLMAPEGPVFARNAFLMAHELPGMSWVKAGIFQPAYGTYGDDHTAFVRSWFEQDVSTSDDTVLGVEVGTAPNYPFAAVSVFRNDTSFINGGELDPGWGAAAQAGYRDLGWSVQGHAMTKRRQQQGRGDLAAVALAGGLNPAFYWEKVPLTLLGEVSVGRREEEALEAQKFAAAMVELSWILRSGILLRGRYDTGWQDLAHLNDRQDRISGGLEISPITGFTLTAMGRVLRTPQGNGKDVFITGHFWF